MNKGAGRLGLCDLGVVGDDTIQETATRLGVIDVLGEDSAANALVDDDTDGALGDVENAASGTVVHFVGHTLLDGTVALDVDDITLAVAREVRLQANDTLLAEALGEHVTRTASDTFGVRHLVRFLLSVRQSKSDSKMG